MIGKRRAGQGEVTTDRIWRSLRPEEESAPGPVGEGVGVVGEEQQRFPRLHGAELRQVGIEGAPGETRLGLEELGQAGGQRVRRRVRRGRRRQLWRPVS